MLSILQGSSMPSVGISWQCSGLGRIEFGQPRFKFTAISSGVWRFRSVFKISI